MFQVEGVERLVTSFEVQSGGLGYGFTGYDVLVWGDGRRVAAFVAAAVAGFLLKLH